MLLVLKCHWVLIAPLRLLQSCSTASALRLVLIKTLKPVCMCVQIFIAIRLKNIYIYLDCQYTLPSPFSPAERDKLSRRAIMMLTRTQSMCVFPLCCCSSEGVTHTALITTSGAMENTGGSMKGVNCSFKDSFYFHIPSPDRITSKR